MASASSICRDKLLFQLGHVVVRVAKTHRFTQTYTIND
ncbi:Uncharacterised protein [Vibrio cholerae]|nr:Uncharacterised protein [Vibrio cholerae]